MIDPLSMREVFFASLCAPSCYSLYKCPILGGRIFLMFMWLLSLVVSAILMLEPLEVIGKMIWGNRWLVIVPTKFKFLLLVFPSQLS